MVSALYSRTSPRPSPLPRAEGVSLRDSLQPQLDAAALFRAPQHRDDVVERSPEPRCRLRRMAPHDLARLAVVIADRIPQRVGVVAEIGGRPQCVAERAVDRCRIGQRRAVENAGFDFLTCHYGTCVKLLQWSSGTKMSPSFE